MEFLQIWIGRKPKKEILECIESVIDKVTDNDTYTLISSSNFMKDNPKVNWISYKKYIKEMLKDDKINKSWERIPTTIDYHWCRSDILRFYYLSMNEDVLYVDTDVVLESSFDLQKSKTYFPKRGRHAFDYYIMYGDKDTFKDMLNRVTLNTRTKPYFFGIVNHKRYINTYEDLPMSYKHLGI